MTVKELIEKLQKVQGDLPVKAFYGREEISDIRLGEKKFFVRANEVVWLINKSASDRDVVKQTKEIV